jgi:hypothetical protein
MCFSDCGSYATCGGKCGGGRGGSHGYAQWRPSNHTRQNSSESHLPQLTLIQSGSGKSINYQGPFSLDLAFTRCNHTSPGFWQVCIRALRFHKSAQNIAVALVHLERVREWAQLRTRLPPQSTLPGTRN